MTHLNLSNTATQSDPTVMFFSIFFGFALLLMLSQAVMMWPFVTVKLNGGNLTFMDVALMRVQRVPARLFVDAHLALVHRGVEHSADDLRKTYLAHKPDIRTARDLIDLMEQQRGDDTE